MQPGSQARMLAHKHTQKDARKQPYNEASKVHARNQTRTQASGQVGKQSNQHASTQLRAPVQNQLISLSINASETNAHAKAALIGIYFTILNVLPLFNLAYGPS